MKPNPKPLGTSWALVVLVSVSSQCPVEAQPQAYPLVSRVEVSQPSYLPFEPADLLIVVTNSGSQDFKELVSWEPFVYLRPLDPGVHRQWSEAHHVFMTPLTPDAVPPTEEWWLHWSPEEETPRPLPLVKRVDLKPGQYHEWVETIEFQHPHFHLLENGGAIEVVASVDRARSPEGVFLRVREPQGREALAWKALKGLSITRLFSERMALKYFYDNPSNETFQRLEDFRREFSDTEYGLIAGMAVGFAWMAGANGKKDFENARQAFLEVSSQATGTRATRALYYCGRCHEMLGELDQATNTYKRALALEIDPVTRFQAGERLKALEQQR